MCQRGICLAENESSIYITSKENYEKLEMPRLNQFRKLLVSLSHIKEFITVSLWLSCKSNDIKRF